MISIIIPIHNLCGENNFLQKCLDSLLKQTYTNFEVLLMENGSTDNTPQIAEESTKKDNRFKLHILEEIGIPNARNEGLKKATGKYITFIDGDDYVSEDYLEELINAINISPDIDMAFAPCKLLYTHNKKLKPFHNDYTPRVISNGDISSILQDGMVWGKIYKSSFIKDSNIYFDKELSTLQDTLFITELKLRAKKIAITNKGTYYYIQGRQGQITTNKIIDRVHYALLLIEKLENLFKKYNTYNEYKGWTDKMFISLFIGDSFANAPLRKMDKAHGERIIKDNMKKIISTIPDNKICPRWMIRWYKRFVKFAKWNLGLEFIKFMRIYRNIILQPLGIKYSRFVDSKFIAK